MGEKRRGSLRKRDKTRQYQGFGRRIETIILVSLLVVGLILSSLGNPQKRGLVFAAVEDFPPAQPIHHKVVILVGFGYTQEEFVEDFCGKGARAFSIFNSFAKSMRERGVLDLEIDVIMENIVGGGSYTTYEEYLIKPETILNRFPLFLEADDIWFEQLEILREQPSEPTYYYNLKGDKKKLTEIYKGAKVELGTGHGGPHCAPYIERIDGSLEDEDMGLNYLEQTTELSYPFLLIPYYGCDVLGTNPRNNYKCNAQRAEICFSGVANQAYGRFHSVVAQVTPDNYLIPDVDPNPYEAAPHRDFILAGESEDSVLTFFFSYNEAYKAPKGTTLAEFVGTPPIKGEYDTWDYCVHPPGNFFEDEHLTISPLQGERYFYTLDAIKSYEDPIRITPQNFDPNAEYRWFRGIFTSESLWQITPREFWGLPEVISPEQSYLYELSPNRASRNGSFYEWILLLNPHPVETEVVLSLYNRFGLVGWIKERIPPRTRKSFCLNDYLMSSYQGSNIYAPIGNPRNAWDVSSREITAHIKSSLPIVAERAQYFEVRKIGNEKNWKVGASCASPSSSPRTQHLFPDGCGEWGWISYYSIYNPDEQKTARITVTFQFEGGAKPSIQTVEVLPKTRFTLTGPDRGNYSALLRSDLPVYAEQAMYFRYGASSGGGAEQSIVPSRIWRFPEGHASATWETWVLIQNPDAQQPARVKLSILPVHGQGDPQEFHLEVPPNGRYTFPVYANFRVDPVGGNWDFGVELKADREVAALMTLVCREGDGGVLQIRGVPQETCPNTWYLAEGCNYSESYRTYLQLVNFAESPAKVEVTFLREDGRALSREYWVSGRSRVSLHTFAIPELCENSFGMVVKKVSQEGEIAVSRSVKSSYLIEWYSRYQGAIGIHGNLGTPAEEAAQNLFFAEGYTGMAY